MTYKLVRNFKNGDIDVVNKIEGDRMLSIPFAPDNTDYANFKRDIEEGKAELQDADGNVMSQADAQEFIRSLP